MQYVINWFPWLLTRPQFIRHPQRLLSAALLLRAEGCPPPQPVCKSLRDNILHRAALLCSLHLQLTV